MQPGTYSKKDRLTDWSKHPTYFVVIPPFENQPLHFWLPKKKRQMKFFAVIPTPRDKMCKCNDGKTAAPPSISIFLTVPCLFFCFLPFIALFCLLVVSGECFLVPLECKRQNFIRQRHTTHTLSDSSRLVYVFFSFLHSSFNFFSPLRFT